MVQMIAGDQAAHPTPVAQNMARLGKSDEQNKLKLPRKRKRLGERHVSNEGQSVPRKLGERLVINEGSKERRKMPFKQT
jgi:hypothetical protein